MNDPTQSKATPVNCLNHNQGPPLNSGAEIGLRVASTPALITQRTKALQATTPISQALLNLCAKVKVKILTTFQLKVSDRRHQAKVRISKPWSPDLTMVVPPNLLTVLWLISRVTPLSINRKTSMTSTFLNIRSLVRVWWWMTRPDSASRQWPKPSVIRRCPASNQYSRRSLWPSLISMINNPLNCCSTSWCTRNSRINKPHKLLRWREKFRIYKIKSKWVSKSMRMSRCKGKLSKTLSDKFTSWNNNKNLPSKSRGENAASQLRKWNGATVIW